MKSIASSARSFIAIMIMLLTYSGFAGIICPADQEYHCSQVQFGIPELPAASGTEGDIFLTITYIDDEHINMCDVGYIDRHWFIDRNTNGVIDADEPTCVQKLTFSGTNNPVTIEWPRNLVLSCIDEEEDFGKPIINANSCDLISVNYTDEIYENSDAECYKILRRYNIWNSCAHPDGTMDSWEHTQIIKVIDEDAPELEECATRVIPLEDDCLATVTLSKSAEDVGDCPAQLLTWYVEVDIDLDGVVDLNYGPNESGIFLLEPTPSPGTIEITLPERMPRDIIQVDWKVHDQCGNFDACLEKVRIEDKKPPTPYCVLPLYFKLNANHVDSLIIPVELFDQGGFDNCSHDLKLSYSSNVDDTVKVIKCGDTGFQFDRIYFTDKAGNQDFCEVFSLVFDNGTCGGQGVSLPGTINYHGAGAMPEASLLYPSINGDAEFLLNDPSFMIEDLLLDEDAEMSLDIPAERIEVNIGDAIRISNYVLGLDTLSRLEQYAADLNEDGKVDIEDLFLVRNIYLEDEVVDDNYRVIFESNDRLDASESMSLYGSLDDHLDVEVIQKAHLDFYDDYIAGRGFNNVYLETDINHDGTVRIYNTSAFMTSGMTIAVENASLKTDLAGEMDTDLSRFLNISKGHYPAGSFEIVVNPTAKDWDPSSLSIEIRDESIQPYEIIFAESKENIGEYIVVPNPVNEEFEITQLPDDVDLFIYDLYGRLVDYTREGRIIKMSGNQGVYLAKFKIGNVEHLVKFVKI